MGYVSFGWRFGIVFISTSNLATASISYGLFEWYRSADCVELVRAEKGACINAGTQA